MPKAKTKDRAEVTKAKYWRAQYILPKRLDLFLTRFGLRIEEAGGGKLSKTAVVRALIQVLSNLQREIDLTDVRDEEELTRRIQRGFEGRRKSKARQAG